MQSGKDEGLIIVGTELTSLPEEILDFLPWIVSLVKSHNKGSLPHLYWNHPICSSKVQCAVSITHGLKAWQQALMFWQLKKKCEVNSTEGTADKLSCWKYKQVSMNKTGVPIP